MKRLLATALISVLFVLVSGVVASVDINHHAEDPTSPKLHEQQTVMVSLPTGHGSGVMIGDGLVLTAAHVAVEGINEKLTVTDAAGNTTTVTVEWMDETADVAVLKLDNAIVGYKVANLACGLPDAQVRDSVTIVGYPLGFKNVHTWGYVAADVMPREGGQINQIINAVVVPGNSGGPMFDVNGNVAGIAVVMPMTRVGIGIPNLLPGLAYVIPRSVICKELSEPHDTPVAQGTGKIFPSGNIGP